MPNIKFTIAWCYGNRNYFAGDTLSSFISITNNLKVAKADTFDSLYALRQIRSISDKVNADESHYLLDLILSFMSNLLMARLTKF